MENTVKHLISQASRWIGYLEKKSNAQLDDLTANAGSGNYTCFARDYQTHTGQNLQAQPWCAMFVSEVFVQAFDPEVAKKLLGGSLYHYCPTGVNQFKKAGRWSMTPEPGAVIFFTNGQRAYHTGIVTEVTATRIKTIEGNTSGASGVVENGGGVCQKAYSKSYSKIMGYGLPDWSLVPDPVKKSGWQHTDIGWWYMYEDGSYPINKWELINHHWYLFNRNGYMVTGWHRWDGKVCDPDDGSGDWYFLDNTKNGLLEGACWHSQENGIMEVWWIK